MGTDARLSCTAIGHAWLLTMSDERALELVSRQGFGAPKDYGAEGANDGAGAAEDAARRARTRLRDDRRGLRARHDRGGRAGARAR
jgi:DNA-binding IclR family transcriptional regulator